MISRIAKLQVGAVLFVVVSGLSRTGQAEPTFIFQPVSSSGPYVIVGQEIRIPRGGVEVELEVLACGWSEAPGSPSLGALWVNVDVSGLLGAEAIPPNPGVDLHSLGNPGNYAQGVFITHNVCSNNGRDCTAPKPPCVGGGSGEGFCLDNPRELCLYIVPTGLPVPIPPQIEFSQICHSSAMPNVPCELASTRGYCGTAILVIPANAVGSYTMGFIDDSNFTAMTDFNGILIEPLQFLPGTITILDCNGNGIADGVDLESGSSFDCQVNGIPDECEADGDGDGTPDECDLCAADPNKIEPDICGCGVAETGDSDADGIEDCIDQCAGVDDNVFAPGCVAAIPAVSTWGLVVMTLILLTAVKVSGRPAEA